ncbi:MAG: hypothetical protein JW982_00075 [Spirochaetes bacterium]|nr:hypothetical protein [Spirochaetota bacterium]
MKIIKITLLTAVSLMSFKLTAAPNAAAFTRVNQIGAEYVAMGCTGEATAEDIFAMYWNPAGLVNMADKKLSVEQDVREKAKNGEIDQITEEDLKNFSKPTKKNFFVFGSSASMLDADRQIVFGAAAFNIKRNVLAFGISSVYSGGIEKRDSSGNYEGETFYSGSAGYISYGYYLKSTSVGFSIKPLYETVDNQTYAGGSADVGIKTEIFKLVKIGFVFQDIGIGLYPVSHDENINERYERGSSTARVGFAISPQNSNFVASSSIIKKLESDDALLNFGIKYTVYDSFAVAAGFSENNFTGGCKIGFSIFEISYSLVLDNIDDNYNNTVSLMMVF